MDDLKLQELLKLLYERAILSSEVDISDIQQPFLVAADGTFLGILSSNKFDINSISNTYGAYGSKYSGFSILNKYSQYGSPYSSMSPFNKYTSTPPKIYYQGKEIGFLTKNYYLPSFIDAEEVLKLLDSGQTINWYQTLLLLRNKRIG